VCTENLILIDYVTESSNVNGLVTWRADLRSNPQGRRFVSSSGSVSVTTHTLSLRSIAKRYTHSGPAYEIGPPTSLGRLRLGEPSVGHGPRLAIADFRRHRCRNQF